MRERIGRSVWNLAATLLDCAFEEGEVVGVALLALAVVAVLWVIGTACYELITDPHTVSKASLDSLSINPYSRISP